MKTPKNAVPVVLAAIVLLTTACSSAMSYSGQLWYNSQISAGAKWADPTTYFKWTVTDSGNGWWHYDYMFHSPAQNISHLILGMSSNITAENWTSVISGFAVNGQQCSIGSGLVGPVTYGKLSSNPGLETSLYGIKIENLQQGSTDWRIVFDARRKPVWGDFYAKSAKDNYAFNAGLNGMFDSTAYITRDGNSSDIKIAVPDTYPPAQVVPEASSMMLCATGLFASGGYWFKRRK